LADAVRAAEAATPPAAEIAELRRQLEEATRPRAHLPLLRLEPVRSDGDAPYRLSLGDGPEWVVLVVEPPGPPEPPYALSVEDAAGGEVWRAEGVALDAYGALTVSLYSPTLAAGVHRLRAVGDDGAPFSITFDIRR
ncbi:MAG: hypothetical protein AAFX50_23285, partial [Acidobacteriota bacterium]